MGKKALAILAFNIYAITLISAFQENTGSIFEASFINQMRFDGADLNPREWGWGDHYIWRLFASVVVTFIAGFLAGAISKENGAKVAATANVPSVLMWAVGAYFLAINGADFEASTGYLVISVIAIPLTTLVAYWAGQLGEEVQQNDCPENTVLGIKGYHWVWIAFIIYPYSLGIIFVAAKFLSFQFSTWGDIGILVQIFSLILLLPVLAWVFPLYVSYQILLGDILKNQNAFTKALANFGILVSGVFLATGVQVGLYWILSSVSKL